jgi:hypothetical protein
VARKVYQSADLMASSLESSLAFLDHEARGADQHRARYCAIVLAMYATLEGCVRQTARLCGEHIAGGAIGSFDQLPTAIRVDHIKLSMLIAEGLSRREPSLADLPDVQAEHVVLRPFGTNWWRVSGLFLFDRNIWPETLQEKIVKLGGKNNLMVERSVHFDQPFTADPLATLSWLVRERNQIAHGNAPDNLLDPGMLRQLSNDLVDVAKSFAREMSILACDLGGVDAIDEVGTIETTFGPSTLGFSMMHSDLSVDDEVWFALDDGSTRVRRVRSMQRHGASIRTATAGLGEVAVSFDRRVANVASVRHLA